MTTIEIPLHDIEVADRAREDLDIEDLVESIRQVGLLQPVIVRPTESGFRLVAGGRRLHALEMLGEMLVRAEVRDLDDPTAELVEAIENGIRKAFTPSEAAGLGMRLEQRIADDPELLGKLPTSRSDEDRPKDRVAQAVGMSRRTYDKACEIVSYEPRSADGGEVRANLETAMDASGKVDGFHRHLKALERAEDWLTHDLDDVRTAAEQIIARAAWDDGDLADEVAGLTGWVEQEEAFSATTPPVADQVGGADPAEGATADEHPTTPTSGEGDSGSATHQEPESTPDEIPGYLLPDRWFPAPSWPTRGTWTILTERVADDRRPRYRYWINAGRSGVHSGAYQPDENAAVEDYLDHAWPGWRALPTVEKCPDTKGGKTGEKAIQAWFDATAEVYPEGWLEAGGPIITSRGASGHRHHIAGRGPWVGIDCAWEAIAPDTVDSADGEEPPAPEELGHGSDGVNAADTHGEGGSPVPNEADDETSPGPPGVEDPSEEAPVAVGDLHEGEPVRPGSPSTTLDRKREPKKNPVRRAEAERVTALVSELAELVQDLPPAELLRWLATHGDTGGAPGARLRSDLTVLIPYLEEVRHLTYVG